MTSSSERNQPRGKPVDRDLDGHTLLILTHCNQPDSLAVDTRKLAQQMFYLHLCGLSGAKVLTFSTARDQRGGVLMIQL